MVTHELLGSNKGQTPMPIDRITEECTETDPLASSGRESTDSQNLVMAINDERSPSLTIVAHPGFPIEADLKLKIQSHTDVVSEFLAHYRREWDYYDQAARLCAEQCERSLEKLGIQAMVTFRAKRPDRLEKKLRHRTPEGVQVGWGACSEHEGSRRCEDSPLFSRGPTRSGQVRSRAL